MKADAKSPGSTRQGKSLSLTEANRTLDHVLDRVAAGSVITITRHGKPGAVLIPVETYEQLLANQKPLGPLRSHSEESLAQIRTNEQLLSGPDPLAALRDQFDARFARMQTPVHRAGVDALFAATPEELGRAAVRAAQKRKELK